MGKTYLLGDFQYVHSPWFPPVLGDLRETIAPVNSILNQTIGTLLVRSTLTLQNWKSSYVELIHICKYGTVCNQVRIKTMDFVKTLNSPR